MDYEKFSAVDEFLRKRKQEKNRTFNVKVFVNQHGFRSIDSGFSVSESVAKSDYILDFENEILRPYIGGYLQKRVKFLKNVRFDGSKLYFSVENIDVSLE